MTSSSATEVVQLALRAPRVVVLFRADDRWRDWARLALQYVSEIWGGAGFVLVPYDPDSAEVPAALLPLVIAYDPDHVVTMSPLVSDWAVLAPDELDLGDNTVEDLAGIRHPDPAAATARSAVAAACSPLRLPPGSFGQEPAGRGQETVMDVQVSPNAGRLLRIPDGPSTMSCLAVSPAWTGSAALWAAVRAGVPGRPDPYPRPQPEDGTLFAWTVLSPAADPPQDLLRQPTSMQLSVLAKGQPTWFAWVDPALRFFYEGWRPPGAVLVLGETAADFAMAMLYDRLTGYAQWLPAEFDLGERAHRIALFALDDVIRSIANSGRESYVTSASLPPDELQHRFDALQAIGGDMTFNGEPIPTVRTQSLRLGGPSLASSLGGLFLKGSLNERTSAPVLVKDSGRRVFQTGLTSPLVTPEDRAYPQESPAFPYWYVDVTLEDDPLPRARDLPGEAVAVLPKILPDAAVRRSRAGYTFHAVNPGLIPAGATIAGRLARAQLIRPTMTEWVETIARASGMQARLSHPGQHANLLAQRLGSRQQLVDLLHQNSALLRPFAYRDSDHPRPRLLPAHGDTLNKTEDVLTLAGITAAAPDLDLNQIRRAFDSLMSADLLWPGLTLSCHECRTVSHVRLDQLGNTYRCPRCGATNPLTHHRWDSKGDPADPAWYYDLHPIFRQLLHDHGDVPLTAAAVLQSQATTYTDVAETEFRRPGASKPSFEIDLIAQVDNQLVIAEAKSSSRLAKRAERRDALRKLLAAADLLQADRIVLATSAASGWNEADIDFARAAVSRHPTRRPLAFEVLELTP